MSDNNRYITLAYDYVRSLTALPYGGAMLDRGDAGQIVKGIARAIGMDAAEMTRKLAEYHDKHAGDVAEPFVRRGETIIGPHNHGRASGFIRALAARAVEEANKEAHEKPYRYRGVWAAELEYQQFDVVEYRKPGKWANQHGYARTQCESNGSPPGNNPAWRGIPDDMLEILVGLRVVRKEGIAGPGE